MEDKMVLDMRWYDVNVCAICGCWVLRGLVGLFVVGMY